MELLDYNLDRICRVCKAESSDMWSIYDELKIETNNPRIDEMLMACTAIQVNSKDGLPALICQVCFQQLQIAYAFKLRCESTDSTLREYTKNMNKMGGDLELNDLVETTLTNTDESTSLDLVVVGENNTQVNGDEAQQETVLQLDTKPIINSDNEVIAPPEVVTRCDFIEILEDNHLILTCRECFKVFTTLDGLKCHKRVHSGALFKCGQCEKVYTRLNHLQRHEQSHGRRKMHVCKICNKTLTRFEHLKRHLVTHLKEKPFACTKCGRGFSRQEHLLNHTERCKGDRVHICDICNKGFNRADSLSVHRALHGDNVPAMPTIDNLDNIEEHYLEIDCGGDFSPPQHYTHTEDDAEIISHHANHDQTLVQCLEPQVSILTAEGDGDVVKSESKSVTLGIVNRKRRRLIEDEQDSGECIGVGGKENAAHLEFEDDGRLMGDEFGGEGDDYDDAGAADVDDLEDTKDALKLELALQQNNSDLHHHKNKSEIDNDEDYDEEDDLPLLPKGSGQTIAKLLEETFARNNVILDDDGDVVGSDDTEYKPQKLVRRVKRGRGRPRKNPHLPSNMRKQKIPGRKRGRPRKTEIKREEWNEDFEDGTPINCPECNELFTSMHALDSHCTIHAGKRLFKCSVCLKEFSRSAHLKRHEMSHSELKPYSCDICTKRFNRRDHLNQHMKLHSRAQEYECDICKRPFSRPDHLIRHKANKHGVGERVMGEKKYKCALCGKGFTTEKYRDVHMKGHTGEKRYRCKLCDKLFLNKSHLSEHMKFHNDNSKKFLCSECGQRFIRNDYLVIHMRRHRGEKPFKCKFCGKGFPRTTDLTVHERYHTGEKTHLCVICGRGFGRAYNLTVHMRTHTGEKPYQCTYCDAAFAQGNDLKAHVRRHTGERFQCDYCPETFLMGYLLTQHKRTVHGLNVVSNIRRLQPVKKLDPNDPDEPPPITIPLPVPIIPTTILNSQMQQLIELQAQQLQPLQLGIPHPSAASASQPSSRDS